MEELTIFEENMGMVLNGLVEKKHSLSKKFLEKKSAFYIKGRDQ
jgi:hypothetical protein